MSQQDLLIHTIQTLDRAEIEYMVTGSIVSSLQGEPRSTHDIDVVVSITPDDIPRLLSAFSRPRFLTDEDAIREALRFGGTFNVLDTQEGDKIDFWMLLDDPFDRSRFSRKYPEEVFGVRMMVSSPEDTILAKLRWAKVSGGSERQMRDVLGVYEVQQPNLDLGYLTDWAERLDVTDLLDQIKRRATGT